METAVQPRAFYSKAAGLSVNVGVARRVLDKTTGEIVTTPTKIAEFTPQQNGYGRLTTSDPEIIEALEKHPDVLSPDAYAEKIMPPGEHVRQLKEQLAELQKRAITSENGLLSELEKQGKLPKAK